MILETQLSAHDICMGNLLFMRVSQIWIWIYILFVLEEILLDLMCVRLRYFIADTLKQLLTSTAASTCHGPQWFKCSLFI